MYHEYDIPCLASYKFQFIASNGSHLFPEAQRFVRLIGDESNALPDLAHLIELSEILLESQGNIEEYEQIMEYKNNILISYKFWCKNGATGVVMCVPWRNAGLKPDVIQ
jgi:hypothetical protein